MAAIAIFPHTQRNSAVVLAEDTAEWLRAVGHDVQVLMRESHADREVLLDGLSKLDLAISLGGDGSMLRTVDLVSPVGVPVLGVNMGNLGYLTVVEPVGLRPCLERFLTGDFQIERRMTLVVEVFDASGSPIGCRFHALNDAVLQRSGPSLTARLSLSLSGTHFLDYEADSLIVSTPTGSTAYNLSARGPIVSPRARVIVVTPVAAHMLFDRALVLPEDEEVAIDVLENRHTELVVDGASRGRLAAGHRLTCRAGDHDALLVNFGGRDFRRTLKQKFGLADR
jgi:NAD+ kinase